MEPEKKNNNEGMMALENVDISHISNTAGGGGAGANRYASDKIDEKVGYYS